MNKSGCGGRMGKSVGEGRRWKSAGRRRYSVNGQGTEGSKMSNGGRPLRGDSNRGINRLRVRQQTRTLIEEKLVFTKNYFINGLIEAISA